MAANQKPNPGSIAMDAKQLELELQKERQKTASLQHQLNLYHQTQNWSVRNDRLLNALQTLTSSNTGEGLDDVDAGPTNLTESSHSNETVSLDPKELLRTISRQAEQMRELRETVLCQQQVMVTLAQRQQTRVPSGNRDEVDNNDYVDSRPLSQPIPCSDGAPDESNAVFLIGDKEIHVSRIE